MGLLPVFLIFLPSLTSMHGVKHIADAENSLQDILIRIVWRRTSHRQVLHLCKAELLSCLRPFSCNYRYTPLSLSTDIKSEEAQVPYNGTVFAFSL